MLPVHDAAGLFIKTKLRGFPVMRDHPIVGQLKHYELLNALINHGSEHPECRLSPLCTDVWTTNSF